MEGHIYSVEMCTSLLAADTLEAVQIMYSYAANGKAEVPCRLSLTGCIGDIRKNLEKHSGFENWLLHREEKSYIDVFEDRKKDLVYLTADSENVLETLDKSKIYIVGGLVDRNRWKGITAEKAKNQGIATAKLPIGEHMKMLSSQVRKWTKTISHTGCIFIFIFDAVFALHNSFSF